MNSVANRYAIALLSIAREENKVKDYISQTEQVIDILDSNDDLVRLLKDYGLKSEEKKETLDLCFKGKIDEYILNLFYVVIDNKRGNIFKEVLEEFVRIAYLDLNIKKGFVFSAKPLTNDEIHKIEQRTSEIIKSTVILVNKIDQRLMGGFKIQVDDFVIDQSIAKKIEDLKNNLLTKEGK